jgi:hypothetical protein
LPMQLSVVFMRKGAWQPLPMHTARTIKHGGDWGCSVQCAETHEAGMETSEMGSSSVRLVGRS